MEIIPQMTAKSSKLNVIVRQKCGGEGEPQSLYLEMPYFWTQKERKPKAFKGSQKTATKWVQDVTIQFCREVQSNR